MLYPSFALYEAHVLEFLKHIVTLIAVPPGPSLQLPELLSITYINTGTQRRSLLIYLGEDGNSLYAILQELRADGEGEG